MSRVSRAMNAYYSLGTLRGNACCLVVCAPCGARQPRTGKTVSVQVQRGRLSEPSATLTTTPSRGVVDEDSRECLAILVARRLRSTDVLGWGGNQFECSPNHCRTVSYDTMMLRSASSSSTSRKRRQYL